MAAGGGSPATGGASRPQPVQPLSAFGPTDRPLEANTSGIPFGPGAGTPQSAPNDTVMMLQAMAAVWPSPALFRLIRQAQQEKEMGPNG